jgi:hypothetical protein
LYRAWHSGDSNQRCYVIHLTNELIVEDNVAHKDSNNPAATTSAAAPHHQVRLRLLANWESYFVNDVLRKTSGPPDIDHNWLEHKGMDGDERTPSVANLHSRNMSFGKTSIFASMASKGSGSALNKAGTSATAARKIAVGFTPAPPPYHRPKNATAVQAMHLNSTDGLVVVSAFLPVVLHRSDQGQWSADWDYDVLLSMQMHLRVTRIGVVKWRGWHGNTNKDGSPEAGVPVNKHQLVEDCLRAFNCVPVWMDTTLFGEMWVVYPIIDPSIDPLMDINKWSVALSD